MVRRNKLLAERQHSAIIQSEGHQHFGQVLVFLEGSVKSVAFREKRLRSRRLIQTRLSATTQLLGHNTTFGYQTIFWPQHHTRKRGARIHQRAMGKKDQVNKCQVTSRERQRLLGAGLPSQDQCPGRIAEKRQRVKSNEWISQKLLTRQNWESKKVISHQLAGQEFAGAETCQ